MKHLAFAFCLALPAPAMAATSFSETDDFPGASLFPTFGGVIAGVLAAGENTIFGALAGQCDVGDCNPPIDTDAQDSLVVELPVGLQIDTISIASLGEGPAGFVYSFAFRDGAGTFNFLDSSLDASETTGNLLAVPLLETIELSIYGQSARESGDFTVNYQVTIGVSESAAPVPLPAAGLFGLGGIGALAALRARRSRSA
jgi:hypothetical protein